MKIRAWFKKAAAKLAAPFVIFWKISLSVKRDIILGLKIIPKAWSVYVLILVLSLANISIWGCADLITSAWYICCVIAGSLVLLFGIETYRYIRNGKRQKANDIAEDAIVFYIYYNSLNGISRLTDALMLGVMYVWGFWIVLAIFIPAYFFICLWCVCLYEKFLDEGRDLLKIQYLQELPRKEDKTRWEKFLVWVMKRRSTIFWLGSTFVFEPDIVTLLLKRGQRTTSLEIWRYAIPSNFVCITFWSAVFYLGILGY